MAANFLRKLITTFLLFIPAFFLFSQEIPQRPNPPRLVNDFAGFLTSSETELLENRLVEFSNQTSNQIAIVIVKNLNGYDIDELASLIGEKWGVGQNKFDNGVVILIKPKTEESKGEISIQTGYGLESAIPDAVCKRIIENEILPYFRNQQYYQGINAGIDVIMKLAKGEFNASKYLQQKKAPPAAVAAILFFIMLIIIILVSRSKNRHHSIGHSLPFWMGAGLMNSAFHSNSHSSFGNFSSGSSGFSGFGGGSFGGGGASGSW